MESSVKPVAQSTVSSLDRDSSTLERYMDGDMNPGRSLDFSKPSPGGRSRNLRESLG